MKRLLQVCAVTALVLGAPLAASAQTAFADEDKLGLLSAGALAGAELDTSNNWLLFGADARIAVAHGLEIEPRFTYQPLPNAHIMQIDANVLKNLDLASPGHVRPFFGVGGTLRSLSVSQGAGDTKVGLNIVSGARFPLSSGAGYEPFLMTQYSIVRGQANSYSVVVGASFHLGF